MRAKSRYDFYATSFLASTALLAFLLCGLSTLAIAQSKVSVLDRREDAAPPGKKDKPKLVSIVVTPKELTGNTQNSLKIKISFMDDQKDLQGGTLELEAKESNGQKHDIVIDLDKKKFGRAKGKHKFKTNLIIGDADWLKITAKLRDAADNLSRPKRVKLDVAGGGDNGGNGGGPDWGTQIGNRAVDFTLYDQHGNEVSLHDYWGSVILMDFSPQW